MKVCWEFFKSEKINPDDDDDEEKEDNKVEDKYKENNKNKADKYEKGISALGLDRWQGGGGQWQEWQWC